MSFTPKYSARFELPIIDNVLAIVTRDMKGALDYFYPGENLPDFVERSLGTEKGLDFPILVIGPRSNPVETVDDASHLIEPQAIELKVGVVSDTADSAMRLVMKYVRALDAVLRSANKSDYCANMSNGNGAPFGFHIDVTHTYGPLGANDNRTTYFKPASLELTVNFRER
jgi:hypothetical protein